LLDEHRARIQHEELLTGILAATVGNHSFCPPKEPYTPANFMPSQRTAKRRVKRKRINRALIADSVRAMFNGLIDRQQSNANPN
jgi:hypothetical protein